MGTRKAISEEEVGALIAGMRARGELAFKTEEEYRLALAELSRSELEDCMVAAWKRRHDC